MSSSTPAIRPGDLSNRYSTERILLSEEMYSKGYQSSGGSELATKILEQLSLTRGSRFLDLGCGTGGTSIIASRDYGLTVTGIDLSEDNLQICTERSASAGLQIRYLKSDLANLALPPEKFDAFWCCDVLMYIQDKPSFFSLLKKYLAPHAKGFLADYGVGTSALTPEFKEYISNASYHSMNFVEYSSVLLKAGFILREARDYTDDFVEMMEAEKASLIARHPEFIKLFGEDSYEHLLSRWQRKIDFCKADQMRAFYFIPENEA